MMAAKFIILGTRAEGFVGRRFKGFAGLCTASRADRIKGLRAGFALARHPRFLRPGTWGANYCEVAGAIARYF